ncbi:MAG: family 2 glycosyl transferase [Actinobacteria bacterium]|nr:MAG: family 2 glycosyl transferase [Actinomycetota bacterium]
MPASSGAGPVLRLAPGAPGGAGTVTVIICAYTLDRWECIERAVASVRGQTRPAAQIVLAVDHNAELSARARAALPGVDVVDSAGPKGMCGARNAGLERATGEFVAFLDDDAWAEPAWLAELLAPFAAADVVATGGWAAGAWSEGRPRWFPREFDWVVGCSHAGLPTARTAVRNVIGCNMAFRRDAFRVVGGFRSELSRHRLPTGCDETELCIRIAGALPGTRIVLAPTAVVTQDVPTARANAGYFVRRCFGEGLSKSTVARLVGATNALSSERAYTFRVLPAAAARGVGDALQGDVTGLGRCLALITGLAVTAAGYLVGTVVRRRSPRDAQLQASEVAA